MVKMFSYQVLITINNCYIMLHIILVLPVIEQNLLNFELNGHMKCRKYKSPHATLQLKLFFPTLGYDTMQNHLLMTQNVRLNIPPSKPTKCLPTVVSERNKLLVNQINICQNFITGQ